MNRNRQIIISVLALLSLSLVMTGVSYSLLDHEEISNYETSNLEYYYPTSQEANKLTLSDTTPITDEEGEKTFGIGKFFEFSVEGKLHDGEKIPYYITLTKDYNSTLDNKFIKVYLTEVINGEEYPINTTVLENGVIKTFSELEESSILADGETKLLYKGIAQGEVYQHNYRLRVWNGATEVQPTIFEDGTIVYPYQGKQAIFHIQISHE